MDNGSMHNEILAILLFTYSSSVLAAYMGQIVEDSRSQAHTGRQEEEEVKYVIAGKEMNSTALVGEAIPSSGHPRDTGFGEYNAT